jgi:hypothetical protein
MTLLSREQQITYQDLVFRDRLEPGMQALHKLLEYQLEMVKTNLLVCLPAECQGLQGEGRALSKLLRLFSKPAIDRKVA